uniref:Putative mandelate racemase n=1 Tax=uncultured bacterium fosmid pJB190D12_contig II TaxID=1478060 RepID=A0A0H3U9E2_9BACT|nr:putative mandelate racemase [uncultured bacterium fosmid pJB190D12_contig II]
MRRAVVLEYRLLREQRVVRDGHGGDELQRGRLGYRRAPHVRIHLHAVGLGERDDVPGRGDAATGADVRLRDVDAAGRQQVAEAVEGVLVLAARDRHRQLLPQLDVALQILRRDGFLVPPQVESGERPAEPQRLRTAVRVVGVDHQPDRLALDRLADGLHAGDVVLDAVAELHLHQREAGVEVGERLVGEARRLARSRDAVETGGVGLNATAKGATQQLVDRLPVALAHDVPERDVDRADRGDHRSLAAVVARHVVHAVPQHLGVERIAPHDERAQRVLDHRGCDLRGLEPLRERLTPPDQPVVGDDFEQRGGALPDPPLRERKRFRQRALQYVNLQVGDLHRAGSRAVSGPRTGPQGGRTPATVTRGRARRRAEWSRRSLRDPTRRAASGARATPVPRGAAPTARSCRARTRSWATARGAGNVAGRAPSATTGTRRGSRRAAPGGPGPSRAGRARA